MYPILIETLKKLLTILGSPIGYIVRRELRRQNTDINEVLQRRAAESTASYVQSHMRNVKSVNSKRDLMAIAVKEMSETANGLICEFGVYTGDTINHIASLTGRRIYGFDSFEGLPERWRDSYETGKFKVHTLPKVPPNVELIKGWFNETLPVFLKEHEEQASFLHIDCDLYSSTKTIFELFGDRIHAGCIIVFDEYFNYPEWQDGEYKAFQEFIRTSRLDYEYICFNSRLEQVVVKIKNTTHPSPSGA